MLPSSCVTSHPAHGNLGPTLYQLGAGHLPPAQHGPFLTWVFGLPCRVLGSGAAPPMSPTSEKCPSGSNFLPTSHRKYTVFSAEEFIGLILWGLCLIRSSGKGKKQLSLHYTAAQLLEKGVLVEIEDLPTSQYVSSEGRGPVPLSGGGALGWGPGRRGDEAGSLP